MDRIVEALQTGRPQAVRFPAGDLQAVKERLGIVETAVADLRDLSCAREEIP